MTWPELLSTEAIGFRRSVTTRALSGTPLRPRAFLPNVEMSWVRMSVAEVWPDHD